MLIRLFVKYDPGSHLPSFAATIPGFKCQECLNHHLQTPIHSNRIPPVPINYLAAVKVCTTNPHDCHTIAIVITGFLHKAVMTKTLIVFHFLLT